MKQESANKRYRKTLIYFRASEIQAYINDLMDEEELLHVAALEKRCYLLAIRIEYFRRKRARLLKTRDMSKPMELTSWEKLTEYMEQDSRLPALLNASDEAKVSKKEVYIVLAGVVLLLGVLGYLVYALIT